jgi:uncharacterized SAM-binding protein YcdF (DUF218 family)
LSHRVEHVILIFGAAVSADGQPLSPLLRRLEQALVEAQADPEALVVVSGGPADDRPAEAIVMRDWLVAHGVSAKRIALEPCARSTYENARLSLPLVAASGARRLTLVTERFHIRRAQLQLSRALEASKLGAVRITTSAAPDGCGLFPRWLRALTEALKLARLAI